MEKEDNKENIQKKLNIQKKITITPEIQLIKKDSSLDANLFLLPEIEDYRCIICENIPNPEKAYEVICCGILFCKECLIKWISQKPKCPICNKALRNNDDFVRNIKQNNKIFYRTLRKFVIKCPYGCEWSSEWEDLENHLKECTKGVRECKYKYIGCKFVGEKGIIDEHEEKNDKLHLELAMKLIKANYKKETPKNINNQNREPVHIDNPFLNPNRIINANLSRTFRPIFI